MFKNDMIYIYAISLTSAGMRPIDLVWSTQRGKG